MKKYWGKKNLTDLDKTYEKRKWNSQKETTQLNSKKKMRKNVDIKVNNEIIKKSMRKERQKESWNI